MAGLCMMFMVEFALHHARVLSSASPQPLSPSATFQIVIRDVNISRKSGCAFCRWQRLTRPDQKIGR